MTATSHSAKAILARGLAKISASWPPRGRWRVRKSVRRIANRYHLSVNQTFPVRRDGLNWELNPSDLVDRDLFWHGSWEPMEITLLASLLRRGDVILDVGANYGYFSLTAAKLLHGDCRIFAFEPNPVTFARLSRHLALNAIQCVQPQNLGLGSAPSRLFIHVDPSNTGACYLSSSPPDGQPAAETVSVTTLDEFVRDRKIDRINFVKVDVEGYEGFFLDGGANSLRRNTPSLMIEVNPDTLARNAESPVTLHERLGRLGYRQFFTSTDHGLISYTPELFQQSHPRYRASESYYNVWCFREAPPALTKMVRS